MSVADAITSEFAFVTCQPGAEAALKRELTASLSWAAAYQRPGVVTFRSPKALTPELGLESVFARQYGLSLGLAKDVEALAQRVRALPHPLCLQVFTRQSEVDSKIDAARTHAVSHSRAEQPCAEAAERTPEPSSRQTAEPGSEHGDVAREVERELRARCTGAFTDSEVARAGELVLSVVVATGEPLLIGCHRHGARRSPYPGARIPIDLPNAAPSRAYLKIEEAIRTFALPVRAGDTALEIGAAPGGAAYALVQRGVRVYAVDPAAMDSQLLAKAGPSGARVMHLPIAMRDLRRDQLPGRIDWLLIDVHLAPQIALRSARRLASELRPTLVGAVLTLKLNDWSFADRIDSFLAQASEMGLRHPKAKQLQSHRQEIALIGLTDRGLRRV